VLPEIDRLKAEVKASTARGHVESLKRSLASHDKSDASSLRILELQRDRQKIALERNQNNISKLEVHATLAGVVAHQNLYRNNSMDTPRRAISFIRANHRQHLRSYRDAGRVSLGEPDGVAMGRGRRPLFI